MISKHDAGTGIQRVVRALALGLSEEAPEGWEIHFVSAALRTGYRQICWPSQLDSPDLEQVDGRPGDVFLGLDYSLNTIRWHRAQLERFRSNGGSLWFLVHDLLPLQRPDWFSRNTVIRFKAWLDIIAGLADGFLCNSPQTEQDLQQVLRDRYAITGGYRTCVLPMGANVSDSMLQNNAGQNRERAQFNSSAPFSLMVGTLEP
ncbi:MAG TPA: glycosyltransferase family 1 protein, partial [Sphingomicrobium sp.]|nr:glycosyltransferase family 1 protein [Sphingomicrobium sp.]